MPDAGSVRLGLRERARVARRSSRSQRALTACFVGGECASSRARATTTRRSTPPARSRSPRSARRPSQEVGARRSAPPARPSRTAGRRSPGAERAKYLFRIARILQERSREFAVLESLNGGKPIRESRDVDLPLAAAHFFYYAGWADKLEYAFPNRKPKPLGVAGQIIPWNFPLLMLAWKIAPALAAGNTVVLKPAETTPLSALLFCDVLRQAELPPGVVNIVTGDGATGAALVKIRRRQDRLHRLDRGRQGDPARARRHRQEADARARRQGREHHLRRRARSTRRSRGSSTGSTSTRATSAAPARGCSCRSRSTSRVIEKLKRRLDDAARRRPARQEHRRRRDQLAPAAREDRGARRERARRRAPRSTSRRAACRRRATGSCRPSSRTSRRATGSRRRRSSGRCSRCSPSARPTRRSRRRTTRRTACRPASGRRRARGSSGWRSGCAPASIWANTYNRFDPASPFGGYKESGFGREGGRHGLEPYLEFDMSDGADRVRRRPTSSTSAARSRARSRAARTRPRARTSRAARGRTCATRCGPRAARSPKWAGMTAYNRGQVLYRIAEMLEARRAEFAELCSGPRRGRAARSTACVWYAGWADKLAQVLGSSNPVAGPYFNFTVPEPTGVVGDARSRGAAAARASSRGSRPRSSAATRVVAVASEAHPLAAIELAEVLATVGRPGRRRQHPHRSPRASWRRCWRRTWT